MKTGLVSVTFRALSCDEIIDLVVRAGLDGIEWGGDIHVPHGDAKKAAMICEKMQEAKISTACYGSYYHLTNQEKSDGVDQKVLETAIALKAPMIRIWAGSKSPWQASPADWAEISQNAQEFAVQAMRQGIQAAFEFHGDTLTEDAASAKKLLSLCPDMKTLWQPPVNYSKQQCLDAMRAVKEKITNLHVFSWQDRERLALKEKNEEWRAYFSELEDNRERYALLEFVKNDSTDQFIKDAQALKAMII